MAYNILLVISAIIFLFYAFQLAYKKLALDYCKLLIFISNSTHDIKKTYLAAFHKSRGILRHIIKSNLSVIDHSFSDESTYEKGFHNIEKALPFDEVRLLHQMLSCHHSMSDAVCEYLQQEEAACRRYVLMTACSCLRISFSFLTSILLYHFLHTISLSTNFLLSPFFTLVDRQILSVCFSVMLMITVIITMPNVTVRQPALNCQALLWLISFSDLIKTHNLTEAFTLSMSGVSGDFLPHLLTIKNSIEKGSHTVEPLGYVMKYFKDMRFTEDKTVNLTPLILMPYILVFVLIVLQLITDPALVYLWP